MFHPGSPPGPRVMSRPLATTGCSKLPFTNRLSGGDEFGCTCSVAVTGPPALPALRTTGVGTATGKVVTGNVVPVVPAGTVTVAGTTAPAGLLLKRGTT